MGFWKNLLGGGSAAATQYAVVTDDGRWWGVNGCSHYTDNMAAYIHKAVPDFRYQHELGQVTVTLTPDPTIQYVPNAVRVDLAGRRIGHLPAAVTGDANAIIQRSLDSGGTGSVVVEARFSWELKAGPFDAEVRLPRDWAKAQLIPSSQVGWVQK